MGKQISKIKVLYTMYWRQHCKDFTWWWHVHLSASILVPQQSLAFDKIMVMNYDYDHCRKNAGQVVHKPFSYSCVFVNLYMPHVDICILFFLIHLRLCIPVNFEQYVVKWNPVTPRQHPPSLIAWSIEITLIPPTTIVWRCGILYIIFCEKTVWEHTCLTLKTRILYVVLTPIIV